MKTTRFTPTAINDLRAYGGQGKRILARIEAYAANGAGDVRDLVGRPGKRLRVGDFRVIFEENDTEITVTRVGPRGKVYD